MTLFFSLVKADESRQLIYARATAEQPDKTREILDYESAKPEFQKWSAEHEKATLGKSRGNLRAQHNPKHASGRIDQIIYHDDQKAIDVVAKVVDPVDWQKCVEGVYTGLSIGGGYLKKWTDPKDPSLTRYTPRIGEISLVDRPCLDEARIMDLVKMDGSTEHVLLKGQSHSFAELLPPPTFGDLIAKSSPWKTLAAGGVGGAAGTATGAALGGANQSSIGSNVGGEVGSMAGEAIGSAYGGPIGAGVGGFIGGAAGSFIGGKVGPSESSESSSASAAPKLKIAKPAKPKKLALGKVGGFHPAGRLRAKLRSELDSVTDADHRGPRRKLVKRWDHSKHPREHTGQFASKTAERIGRFTAGGAGAVGGYLLGTKHGPRLGEQAGTRAGLLYSRLRSKSPLGQLHAVSQAARTGRMLGELHGGKIGAAAAGLSGALVGGAAGALADRAMRHRRAKKAGRLEIYHRLNADTSSRPNSMKQVKASASRAAQAGRRIKRLHETVMGKQAMEKSALGNAGAAMVRHLGHRVLPKYAAAAAAAGGGIAGFHAARRVGRSMAARMTEQFNKPAPRWVNATGHGAVFRPEGSASSGKELAMHGERVIQPLNQALSRSQKKKLLAVLGGGVATGALTGAVVGHQGTTHAARHVDRKLGRPRAPGERPAWVKKGEQDGGLEKGNYLGVLGAAANPFDNVDDYMRRQANATRARKQKLIATAARKSEQDGELEKVSFGRLGSAVSQARAVAGARIGAASMRAGASLGAKIGARKGAKLGSKVGAKIAGGLGLRPPPKVAPGPNFASRYGHLAAAGAGGAVGGGLVGSAATAAAYRHREREQAEKMEKGIGSALLGVGRRIAGTEIGGAVATAGKNIGAKVADSGLGTQAIGAGKAIGAKVATAGGQIGTRFKAASAAGEKIGAKFGADTGVRVARGLGIGASEGARSATRVGAMIRGGQIGARAGALAGRYAPHAAAAAGVAAAGAAAHHVLSSDPEARKQEPIDQLEKINFGRVGRKVLDAVAPRQYAWRRLSLDESLKRPAWEAKAGPRHPEHPDDLRWTLERKRMLRGAGTADYKGASAKKQELIGRLQKNILLQDDNTISQWRQARSDQWEPRPFWQIPPDTNNPKQTVMTGMPEQAYGGAAKAEPDGDLEKREVKGGADPHGFDSYQRKKSDAYIRRHERPKSLTGTAAGALGGAAHSVGRDVAVLASGRIGAKVGAALASRAKPGTAGFGALAGMQVAPVVARDVYGTFKAGADELAATAVRAHHTRQTRATLGQLSEKERAQRVAAAKARWRKEGHPDMEAHHAALEAHANRAILGRQAKVAAVKEEGEHFWHRVADAHEAYDKMKPHAPEGASVVMEVPHSGGMLHNPDGVGPDHFTRWGKPKKRIFLMHPDEVDDWIKKHGKHGSEVTKSAPYGEIEHEDELYELEKGVIDSAIKFGRAHLAPALGRAKGAFGSAKTAVGEAASRVGNRAAGTRVGQKVLATPAAQRIKAELPNARAHWKEGSTAALGRVVGAGVGGERGARIGGHVGFAAGYIPPVAGLAGGASALISGKKKEHAPA